MKKGNKWLCNKKIKSESGCNVSNNVDDLIHFFLYCENTKQFWTSFYKWWNNISKFNIGRNDIFEECTLFGYACVTIYVYRFLSLFIVILLQCHVYVY